MSLSQNYDEIIIDEDELLNELIFSDYKKEVNLVPLTPSDNKHLDSNYSNTRVDVNINSFDNNISSMKLKLDKIDIDKDKENKNEKNIKKEKKEKKEPDNTEDKQNKKKKKKKNESEDSDTQSINSYNSNNSGNNKFVELEHNFPVPDFNSYSDEQIKNELKKYGMKFQGTRKQINEILREIHLFINPPYITPKSIEIGLNEFINN